jgi:hypothetical protein
MDRDPRFASRFFLFERNRTHGAIPPRLQITTRRNSGHAVGELGKAAPAGGVSIAAGVAET